MHVRVAIAMYDVLCLPGAIMALLCVYRHVLAVARLHASPPPTQGLHKGTSQQALTGGLDDATLVWNMPFDLAWKSTNVFGWPRLVVSVRECRQQAEHCLAHSCLHLAHWFHHAILQVYGYDMLGRNIVAGYSSMLVPTTPGRHTRTLRAFAPVSSSMLQSFIAWLTANRPEFWQPTFVAQSKGREVTRVQPAGTIKVQINVQSRGMTDHGYDCGAGRPAVPRALAGAARRAQPAASAEPAAPGGAVPAGGSGTGPNSSRSSRIGSAAVEARARARAARARAAVEARAEEREASNARSTSSSRRAAASSNDDKLPPITAPGITPAARREQPTIEAVSDAEPDTPAGTLRRGGSTRRSGATQAPRDAGRTAAADSAARGTDDDDDDDLAGAATRRSSSRWRQVSAVTRAVSGSRRTRAAGEQEW